MKLLGALFLILSCGGLGASKVMALKKDVKDTEELLRALDRMEREICGRYRTLPESASLLASEFPRFFKGLEDVSDALRDKSFAEIWQEHFRAVGLSEEAEKALGGFGSELSAGGRPETAFENCRCALKAVGAEAKEELARNGKVYIASGLAAGLLMVIAGI